MTALTSRPYDIRVIDFETSDLPEKGGKIIEIGTTDLQLILNEKAEKIGIIFPKDSTSFRCGLPEGVKIDNAAKATHGIWENELPGSWTKCHSTDLECLTQCEQATTRKYDYFIAHNSKFEEDMFKAYGVTPPPFICTMKVARRVWPRADKHTLPFLRYHGDLEKGKRDERCDPSHSAGPDTWLTSLLLHEFLFHFHLSLEEMHAFTLQPEFHAFCPIGKYKGREWRDVDSGYLNWILKTPDMEEGIKEAARLELNLRPYKSFPTRYEKW